MLLKEEAIFRVANILSFPELFTHTVTAQKLYLYIVDVHLILYAWNSNIIEQHQCIEATRFSNIVMKIVASLFSESLSTQKQFRLGNSWFSIDIRQ